MGKRGSLTVGVIFSSAPRIGPGWVLGAPAELEVRFLQRAIHGIGCHLLEEEVRQHDLGDTRRRLPLAGDQLRIEMGEFLTKTGFPHAAI